MAYKGTWDAFLNYPFLVNGTGTLGDSYTISKTGFKDLGSGGIWYYAQDSLEYQNSNTWVVVPLVPSGNVFLGSPVDGSKGPLFLRKIVSADLPSSGTGSGTVTSVAVTSADITVSGSPITSSGTITLAITPVCEPSWLTCVNWTKITDAPPFIKLTDISGTVPIVYNDTTGVISITKAGISIDGYLDHTDWNTFNNKQNTITAGNLTEVTSSILTITGGTGAVIGTGATLQVKQATTTQSGYISNTDWNTFNNKQNTITPVALAKADDTNVTLTLTGTPTTALLQAVTITAGWTGTLADGRIASSTTWNNKVTSITGTTNRITIGGTTTVPTVDIHASYVGQSTITTLGTITTGTWNGTAIDLANFVSGNLSVSHLNSGTEASNTTFWRGDGIWASAPASAITSVSATNTTLTISPTTGAVLAGLNLSNANTWLATQTFSAVNMNGVVGWNTGLGAIAHITGPTDQTLVVRGATSRGISLQLNTVEKFAITTAGLLSASAQLGWVSGLGAITHLQGPTDQDFVLNVPTGRNMALNLNGVNKFSVNSAGNAGFNCQVLWASSLGSIQHLLGPNDGKFSIGARQPVQQTPTLPGNQLLLTASSATAGAGTIGAQAGGAVTLQSGNAARLTSGDANGGDISAQTGTGIGAGTAGTWFVQIGGANTKLLVNAAGNVIVNGSNVLLVGTATNNGVDKVQVIGSISSTKLNLNGSTSGTMGISAVATTTSYNVILPSAQGTGALTNDGSGNLSWTTATGYTFGSGLTNTSGTVTNDLITGKFGGQTIYGGTNVADVLTVRGSSGSGLGFINFESITFTNSRFIVGHNTDDGVHNLQVFGSAQMYTQVLSGGTSGELTIMPAATTTSYTITMPSAQGTGFLSNNGSGTLSWVAQSSITSLGTVTTGTWNATKIGLAYGGTNADLSATGGTSQVLKQTSAGGAITVAQLAASDLSNGVSGSGALILASSPALTGNPTAITQGHGDNSTKIATTAYVDRHAPIFDTASPSPSITLAANLIDILSIDNQNVSITFNAPSGSPLGQGQRIMFRLRDNGTPQTISWDSIFRAGTVALPPITTSSKWMYVEFIYNGTDTKWDLFSFTNGF